MWKEQEEAGRMESSQYSSLSYTPCKDGIAEAIPGDALNTFRCNNVNFSPVSMDSRIEHLLISGQSLSFPQPCRTQQHRTRFLVLGLDLTHRAGIRCHRSTRRRRLRRNHQCGQTAIPWQTPPVFYSFNMARDPSLQELHDNRK